MHNFSGQSLLASLAHLHVHIPSDYNFCSERELLTHFNIVKWMSSDIIILFWGSFNGYMYYID